MKTQNTLVDQEFLDCLEIDESLPSGLKWSKNYKRHKKDSMCGYKTSDKRYWRQKINGIQYAVHTLIWLKLNRELEPNKTVDHKDNNGLNNKIDNLRLASRLNQLHNRRTWGGSKYKGVNKVSNSYSAYIMYPGEGRIHLGYFKIAEHAAIAHDIAAVHIFPRDPFYKLNFNCGFWLHESTIISEKVIGKLENFFRYHEVV
jgi:hypothetical protein